MTEALAATSPAASTSSTLVQHHLRTHRLSEKQERNLIDFVDEKLLDVTRNYKKRHQPSSSLPTLHAYLSATHTLLALILQIPPVPPQLTLRTALLLRLTGEVLSSITGYAPDAETLPELLEWLDELDRGWQAVLRGEVWDPEAREGVALEQAAGTDGDVAMHDANSAADDASENLPSRVVSQTDRTRLRSMIVAFSSALEEWLDAGLTVRSDGTSGDGATLDLETALERLGLEERFNDMFLRTLREMGNLTGDEADLADVDPDS